MPKVPNNHHMQDLNDYFDHHMQDLNDLDHRHDGRLRRDCHAQRLARRGALLV
jgi:hypothetical protein